MWNNSPLFICELYMLLLLKRLWMFFSGEKQKKTAGNNLADSRALKTKDWMFWGAADVCVLSLPALNKSEMSRLHYISDLLWTQSMTQLKPSFICEYWLPMCRRPTQTEPPSPQMLVVKSKMSGNCDGSDWTGIFIQLCCSQFKW